MNQIILDNTKLIPVLVKIISDFIGFQKRFVREYFVNHDDIELKKQSAMYNKLKRGDRVNIKQATLKNINKIIKCNNKFIILYNTSIVSYDLDFKIDKILYLLKPIVYYDYDRVRDIIQINEKYILFKDTEYHTTIIDIFQNRIDYADNLKYLNHHKSILYLCDNNYIYKMKYDQKIYEKKRLSINLTNVGYMFRIKNNKFLVSNDKKFIIVDIKSGSIKRKFDGLVSKCIRLKNAIVLCRKKTIWITRNNFNYRERISHNYFYNLHKLKYNNFISVHSGYLIIWNIDKQIDSFTISTLSRVSMIDNRLYVCTGNQIQIYE